jgi:hypothetical protein
MDSRGHDKRRCVFLSLRCVALARPYINLKPCALNEEFQDFIPKFNKFYISLKEGFGVERRPKDKVALWIALEYTLTRPGTFTLGHVSVFDKYLH